MSLIASDKGGTDFDPVPAGMQHAVCYAVIDIGTQPETNPTFAPKKKVIFIWELPYVKIKIKKEWTPGQPAFEKELPRAISQTYTNSLSKKANLKPDLESWRGKAFTEAELEGFNIGKVCGANCLLNIIHQTKNGKTFANIAAIMPLMPNMVKVAAVNPLSVFDLDAWLAGTDEKFPEYIPKWIQGKILQSAEYLKAYTDAPAESQAPGGAVGEDAPGDTPF